MTKQASFVTVRGKAISLESKTEGLLAKYSSYAQATSSDITSQEKKLDEQIEKILFQRQEINEELNKISEETPNISASKLSQLQRHREILQEHWTNFRSIRSTIQQERNRLNLLFSVKNDIAQEQQPQDNGMLNDEDQYIQNESRRIDQSHNILDRLIVQAWETRENFNAQSSTLNSAGNKALQTLQRIPGVNTLIGKIGTRRRKNAIILASVTTICILLLFFTW
ncbi:Golgi SNAP receptor complex member 1 [Nakaseomyces bracarensis]|uniref:Golgi SNAP receptor complex member 1 n=1 Tax=Nakaseomyces bracarensis TaxID=273131 RepID=A0ABR4NTR7_9SACH